MHLYEIAADVRRLLDDIGEAEELTLEQSAAMDALAVAFDVKAEAVALYAREVIAESDTVKAEADRLAARARTARNRADSLKAYLLAAMTATGAKSVKGKLATVRVQESTSVDVVDAKSLPPQYMTTPEPVVNRTAILAALKTGEAVPGAALKRSPFLVIR